MMPAPTSLGYAVRCLDACYFYKSTQQSLLRMTERVRALTAITPHDVLEWVEVQLTLLRTMLLNGTRAEISG